MIDITKNKLEIMEDIRTDDNIKPKEKSDDAIQKIFKDQVIIRSNGIGISQYSDFGTQSPTTANVWTTGRAIYNTAENLIVTNKDRKALKFFKKIINKIKIFYLKNFFKVQYNFIIDLKSKFLTEVNYNNFKVQIVKYQQLINIAKKNKQEALVDKLKDNKELFILENILFEAGYTKQIDQKVFAKRLKTYQKKEGKELYLTYLKNFCRILPPEISEELDRVISLNLFDNILILHYDKTGIAEAKTKKENKAEEEARKDPIMFGVIKNSNNLYYICDWIDEYCDLSLDKLEDLLKIKAKDIDISVESRSE